MVTVTATGMRQAMRRTPIVRVGVYPKGHRLRGRVWTRRCRRRRTSLGGFGNRLRRWRTFKLPPPLHRYTTALALPPLGMDLPDSKAAWSRVWSGRRARCWEAAEWGKRISGRPRGGRGGNRSRVCWSGWDGGLLDGECSDEGCVQLSGIVRDQLRSPFRHPVAGQQEASSSLRLSLSLSFPLQFPCILCGTCLPCSRAVAVCSPRRLAVLPRLSARSPARCLRLRRRQPVRSPTLARTSPTLRSQPTWARSA